jgi:uncharacterized membrane protein
VSSAPDKLLRRWLEAGLIDSGTADRIRRFELEHEAPGAHSRFAAIAFGLGALLLIAGVFLFVSAHWADLSPAERFALVLAAVASFHVGGALSAASMPQLATALHAIGTAAMGGGILLCGQIFNLSEHWPGALLLWGFGAACAWYLLRDWPHVLWVAVLVPGWLWGEWIDALPAAQTWQAERIPAIGTVLLIFTYLGATWRDQDVAWRRALSRLGVAALIPGCILLGAIGAEPRYVPIATPIAAGGGDFLGWGIALGLPVGLALAVSGKRALYLVVVLLWAWLVARTDWQDSRGELALYGLYAIGAIGVVAWGFAGRRRDCVNVGVIGFALTICGFYFSAVFDKLGRSLGLIGVGLLFLGGGWLIERMRRRLVAAIAERAP